MVYVKGVYRLTPPTLQDNQFTDLQVDANGYLKTVNMGSAVVGQIQGSIADDAAASGNPVPVGGIMNTTLPTYSNGDRTQLQMGTRGSLNVTLFPTNSNVALTAPTPTLSGQALAPGLVTDAQTLLYNGSTMVPSAVPANTSRLVSAAASVNATLVATSPRYLFQLSGYNAAAAVRYLKIYNKSTAPTVGTDTPILSYRLAASSNFQIDLPGYFCSLGLGYGFTTGAADNDTGALTAADIVNFNVIYT